METYPLPLPDSQLVCSAPPLEHNFGGPWTSEKLEMLRDYLAAYTKVMMRQRQFKTTYIDAFAGSGTVSYGDPLQRAQLDLAGIEDGSGRKFIDGSARVALQIQPGFSRYVFVEKSDARVRNLEELRTWFPEKAEQIVLRCCDANEYLQRICTSPRINWRSNRAVVFLDPYGMQVEWNTIEAIARTQAIDLWCLFPLGQAVNRLLSRDGNISAHNQQRLDSIFGAADWREVFFKTSSQTHMFGMTDDTVKIADYDDIEQYFVQRLRSVFPKVAEKPVRMTNSKQVPLYSLCFAAGNPGKGGDLALKIASHLLGRKKRKLWPQSQPSNGRS